MRLLKFLVLATLAAVIAVVAIGLALPDTVHLERSIAVRARPATAYVALNSFRRFQQWSPWATLDPNTQYAAEGPLWGVGAKLSWSSEHPSVGHGSQDIVAAVPYREIRSRLVFGGFGSDSESTLTIAPDGDGARITWSYDSRLNGDLFGRYLALKLDDWVGADYEQGLQRIRTMVDALPDVGADPLATIALVEVPAQTLALVSGEVRGSSDEAVRAALAAAYARLRAALAAKQIEVVGPPLAITRRFDEATRDWRFDAALPVAAAPAAAGDEMVRFVQGYAGPALRQRVVGAYDRIGLAYAALQAFKQAAGLADHGDAWERYLSDPASTAAERRQMEIVWPVQ